MNMKITKFFLLAATAMTFAACSNDNEPATDNGRVAPQVYAGIGAMQSRAAGTSWDAGDEIGISCVIASTTYANGKYVTEKGDGSFTHVDTPDNHGIYFEGTEEVTFTAYYPFTGPEWNEPTIEGVSTAEQADHEKFDFMFATATASRKNPILSFTDDNAFQHKMTRLVINVKTDPNTAFDAKHVFGGQYYLSGIRHIGKFDITNGTAEATGDITTDWKLNAGIKDTDNNVLTYDMILFPQADASLTFKANIAGQTYVSSAIKPALAAGKSYTYTITVKKTALEVSNCTIKDWEAGNGNGDEVDATMPTE
jgi:putative lipoprotein